MFQKILVPTDLSDHSLCALPVACELAKEFSGEILLFAAVEEPFDYSATVPGATPMGGLDYVEAMRKEVSNSLDALADGLGVPCRTMVVIADRAKSAIVDIAAEIGSDLIVIATHGRSGLGRMMLGSTTEAVLRRAQCPVLTVRPTAPNA